MRKGERSECLAMLETFQSHIMRPDDFSFLSSYYFCFPLKKRKERKTYMTYKKSHKVPCCCGREREREREIWCGDVKRRGTTRKLFMGHNFV
jgi:hypothetical protein